MDKVLLKISGILALVVGIICCITIVGAIAGVPLIIGGLKMKEFSEMSDADLLKNKEPLLVWSIVFLFLCTVSGVLSLIYYLNMENPNMFKGGSSNSSKYQDLEKLNQLYKDKAISKEEYEKEKDRILNS